MRWATLYMSVLLVILLNFRAWPGGIGWEAEDFAVIKPPMQVYEDNPEASSGKYVASPTADRGESGCTTAFKGSVEYKVEVPVERAVALPRLKAGDYFLWVFFSSQNTGQNSWYLQVDDPKSPVGNVDLVWDTCVPEFMPQKLGEEVGPLEEPGPAWEFKPEWDWMRLVERINGQFNVLKIRVLKLSSGKHTLYLWNRESWTKADVFFLADTFKQQPVLPEESPGWAVDNVGKVTTTWGRIKNFIYTE